MPVSSGLHVEGLPKLRRLLKAADPEAQKALDSLLREDAEPIRADAEALAAAGIRRIGPRWSRMRVGVTNRLVYVAPRQRGVKTRGANPRSRPKFADLMEQRAMSPALARNLPRLEHDVEQLFERFAHRWNARD